MKNKYKKYMYYLNGIKRTIESIEILPGICIFKDNLEDNDGLFSSTEGFCEKNSLFVNNKELLRIDTSFYNGRQPYFRKYGLFTKEDLNKLQTIPYFGKHILSNKKPFSYYTSSKEELILLYSDNKDTFFTRTGEKYLTPIVFNHMNGHIDNERYDLNKLEDYLKKNPNQFSNVSRQKIPYYFPTEEISFVWIRTNNEETENSMFINISQFRI